MVLKNNGPQPGIERNQLISVPRYLLEQEVPGSRVGPEPTTDCFTAIMHGDKEGIIPGNALIVDPNKPFRKLNPFGNTFLNRLMDNCAYPKTCCLLIRRSCVRVEKKASPNHPSFGK